MSYPAYHISMAIARPAREVYEYASNPENLTDWAAGLANSTLTRHGDTWITQSPMGEIRIRFAPRNDWGVMDHDVELPDGTVNHNPFRVVKNAEGSEVIFTLFRLPSMDEDAFNADAEMIRGDLSRLKEILEK